MHAFHSCSYYELITVIKSHIRRQTLQNLICYIFLQRTPHWGFSVAIVNLN